VFERKSEPSRTKSWIGWQENRGRGSAREPPYTLGNSARGTREAPISLPDSGGTLLRAFLVEVYPAQGLTRLQNAGEPAVQMIAGIDTT